LVVGYIVISASQALATVAGLPFSGTRMKIIHLTDTHLVAPGKTLYGIDPQARLFAAVADIRRHHSDEDLIVVTGNLTPLGRATGTARIMDD